MKLTIDRFENGCAVCEFGKGDFLRISISALPPGTQEGSILRQKRGRLCLCLDAEQVRRHVLQDKLHAVFGRK